LSTPRDCWSEWLLVRRFAGDADVEARWLEELQATRDRVLDATEVSEDETLLDVGCGDGLIAFGALERGAATVVFSDISRTYSNRVGALRPSSAFSTAVASSSPPPTISPPSPMPPSMS
jgi:arsenite methyltransferase